MTDEKLPNPICNNPLAKVWRWLFSRWQLEKNYENEIERLENTMKTTAICRFNAANRLAWNARITFFTTTVLSLGLIFIPLVQMTRIRLYLPGETLNAIQIFLAVSVLVYSVIIKTGQYEIRSERFNACGNSLKELIREIRALKSDKNTEIDHKDLEKFRKKYSKIISNIENHDRNDYLLTMLRVSETYNITGLIRLAKWVQYFLFFFLGHMVSLFLFMIEILIITDMLGITTVLTPFLQTGS